MAEEEGLLGPLRRFAQQYDRRVPWCFVERGTHFLRIGNREKNTGLALTQGDRAAFEPRP